MTTLNRRLDGKVLVLELAGSDEGNVLDRALQEELARTWDEFENDEALRVAVLHGASNVFSIGHDVAELAADPAVSPVPADAFFPLHLNKPVIAAIDGPCYGLGFELALACDLRVAGQGSRFGFADPNLFVPYRVATVLLPRMAFLGASLELILAGHLFDADAMRSLGLVSELASAGDAGRRALAIAHDMSRRFGDSGDFRKQAIWGLSGVPLTSAMRIARSVR